MRFGCCFLPLLPALAGAYETTPTFDAARAILETRCLECHTEEKAKGNLVLTTRDAMLKGGDGGITLQPGDSDGSALIQRICLPPEDDDHMPPKKSGDPLTPEQIARLKE